MLEIRNLSVGFSSYSTTLKRTTLHTIQSLDLTVNAGEIVAVVGQSGAGKSLLAHAVLGILPKNSSVSGEIFFKGIKQNPLIPQKTRGKKIALIPQSAAFLNPLHRVGSQIARAGFLNGLSANNARQASYAALKRYDLPSTVWKWFPFQLSGGMTKKVFAAAATIGTADLLLADEPTNGLDKPAAQENLKSLRQFADQGKAVVLITHDIELALDVADKISIFYEGLTIEEAQVADFKANKLRHPYSKMLWQCLPRNQFTEAIQPIQKTRRSNTTGCPFYAQCFQSLEDCSEVLPELVPYRGGKVRCCHA